MRDHRPAPLALTALDRGREPVHDYDDACAVLAIPWGSLCALLRRPPHY